MVPMVALALVIGRLGAREMVVGKSARCCASMGTHVQMSSPPCESQLWIHAPVTQGWKEVGRQEDGWGLLTRQPCLKKEKNL